MELLRTRSVTRILMVLGLSVMLAACGAEDDDPDPTATTEPSDAQPTVAVNEEAIPTQVPEQGTATPDDDPEPTNIDMSTQSDVSTPQGAAPGTATPAPATPSLIPVTDEATPVTTPMQDAEAIGTPVAETPVVDEPATSIAAMPETPDDATAGGVASGDGTVGADPETLPDTASPAATPAATPAGTASNATPVADATPTTSAGEPPVVTGCEVAEVPPFTGEPIHLLTVDVNFRTGPGTDCDLALDQPLGEFQAVEVIGGPVIREGDGSEWVQIFVLETEGWVSYEFLDPVE